MSKLLGKEAYKAASAQTAEKLSILTEVILSSAKEFAKAQPTKVSNKAPLKVKAKKR